MFGANEIVGQKYFNQAPANQLYVTSMFMTLQGEGIFAGRPAFFIRLAKCNLACSFCDTFFDDGDWMTFDQIEAQIENTIDQFYHSIDTARPDWTNHGPLMGIKKKMVLVITGGEPTLQANLGAFLDRMKTIFENTQIESNGILHQPTIPIETTIVISPKCVEKNGVATRYIKPNINNMKVASCLKFVMEANRNSPYNDIPQWAHQWAKETNRPVFISPMNVYNDQPAKSKQIRNNGSNRIEMKERSTVDEVISFWEPGLLDMESNQKNHEYVAEYCLRNGYIMNLQMHLYASLA